MKTAISLPDELFERAERQRHATSMSRSEFYASAIAAFVNRIESDDITAQINAALTLVTETDADRETRRELLDYSSRRLAEHASGDDW